MITEVDRSAMARSSLALFLATAGLVAGSFGCGRRAERFEGGEAGESGEGRPELTSPSGAPLPRDNRAGEGGEAGEAGEGGEGGENGEGGEGWEGGEGGEGEDD